MGFAGSKNGGAIYSEGDIYLKGETKVHNNSAVNGGAVFSTKKLFITEKAIIENNNASQNGGGLYVFGEVQISGKGTLQFNIAKNGGACYSNSALTYFEKYSEN